MSVATPRPLTGRKVLMITLAFFGVIIAVNVTLAVKAVSTFPGLEVPNSYVASQEFDARATAQRALGWDSSARIEGNAIRLEIRDAAGVLVIPPDIVARVGHPTTAAMDQDLIFVADGRGLLAPVTLAAGPWRLFLQAIALDGTLYTTRLHLQVN